MLAPPGVALGATHGVRRSPQLVTSWAGAMKSSMPPNSSSRSQLPTAALLGSAALPCCGCSSRPLRCAASSPPTMDIGGLDSMDGGSTGRRLCCCAAAVLLPSHTGSPGPWLVCTDAPCWAAHACMPAAFTTPFAFCMSASDGAPIAAPGGRIEHSLSPPLFGKVLCKAEALPASAAACKHWDPGGCCAGVGAAALRLA